MGSSVSVDLGIREQEKFFTPRGYYFDQWKTAISEHQANKILSDYIKGKFKSKYEEWSLHCIDKIRIGVTEPDTYLKHELMDSQGINRGIFRDFNESKSLVAAAIRNSSDEDTREMLEHLEFIIDEHRKMCDRLDRFIVDLDQRQLALSYEIVTEIDTKYEVWARVIADECKKDEPKVKISMDALRNATQLTVNITPGNFDIDMCNSYMEKYDFYLGHIRSLRTIFNKVKNESDRHEELRFRTHVQVDNFIDRFENLEKQLVQRRGLISAQITKLRDPEYDGSELEVQMAGYIELVKKIYENVDWLMILHKRVLSELSGEHTLYLIHRRILLNKRQSDTVSSVVPSDVSDELSGDVLDEPPSVALPGGLSLNPSTITNQSIFKLFVEDGAEMQVNVPFGLYASDAQSTNWGRIDEKVISLLGRDSMSRFEEADSKGYNELVRKVNGE